MAKKPVPARTIPEALAESARKHADQPALIAADRTLTHAALDAAIARATAALIKEGVKPGSIVGVCMKTSPLHLVTLLALGRIGAGSIHVRPDFPQAAKDALIRQFDVAVLVGDPGVPARIAADPAWLEPGKAPKAVVKAKPNSPWRIALSSGTTGLQKAILSRQEQLLGYLAMHARSIEIGSEDRFLCHRGLDAQLTLNPSMRHLMAGGSVVFAASLSLAHFVEAIDRHQVTQTTMSPAYLRDLLSALPPGGIRFPSLTKLQVAGSAMAPALIEAALARVTPNLYATYGASEMGLVALADPAILRRAPRSVGRVAAGLEAQAVDEKDVPLPAGGQGILRFRREAMPTEYHRNPEATAKAFRDGWFYPGDTGRIDEDGLLYIEGRTDDKLNLDGTKVEPGPIERALQEHPAVVEAVAFAAAPEGNRSGLFAAAILRAPVDEKTLIAHCRSRVGPMHTPARIFFVKDLPRNEGGKVLRAELSKRVARKPATQGKVP